MAQLTAKHAQNAAALDLLRLLFPHDAMRALPYARSVKISSPGLGTVWDGVVLELNGKKTLYVNGKGAEHIQLRERCVCHFPLMCLAPLRAVLTCRRLPPASLLFWTLPTSSLAARPLLSRLTDLLLRLVSPPPAPSKIAGKLGTNIGLLPRRPGALPHVCVGNYRHPAALPSRQGIRSRWHRNVDYAET